MARHPLGLIKHAFPTIRFMLVIGGGVSFALAAITAETLAGTMMSLGWFLLCATVLFLDPENPPGASPVAADPAIHLHADLPINVDEDLE